MDGETTCVEPLINISILEDIILDGSIRVLEGVDSNNMVVGLDGILEYVGNVINWVDSSIGTVSLYVIDSVTF
jgi:hypothetical protein